MWVAQCRGVASAAVAAEVALTAAATTPRHQATRTEQAHPTPALQAPRSPAAVRGVQMLCVCCCCRCGSAHSSSHDPSTQSHPHRASSQDLCTAGSQASSCCERCPDVVSAAVATAAALTAAATTSGHRATRTEQVYAGGVLQASRLLCELLQMLRLAARCECCKQVTQPPQAHCTGSSGLLTHRGTMLACQQQQTSPKPGPAPTSESAGPLSSC